MAEKAAKAETAKLQAAKISERLDAAAKRRARFDLKKAVKEVMPAGVTIKRERGRPTIGGFSRKEVDQLHRQASKYIDDKGGLIRLEGNVQHTALVIMLLDGMLGTEPWRTSNAAVSAMARVRFMENAPRLLDDLRKARGASKMPDLLEGVIDAELKT
jgi:hypothetical protein